MSSVLYPAGRTAPDRADRLAMIREHNRNTLLHKPSNVQANDIAYIFSYIDWLHEEIKRLRSGG